MILDRCNGFMRRLLYQEVPKEFGDAALLETCEDISFVRLSKNDSFSPFPSPCLSPFLSVS